MMRKNYLTDSYVYYAEERAKRPTNFKKLHIKNTPREYCPFCPENEYMTPKRIYATDDEIIRIVPNKYPFAKPTDECYGIHDVLIDTPDHEERMSMYSDEHVGRLLEVIQTRYNTLREDEKIKYIQVFKNQGIDAGASQSHSHWQIAGLSLIPEKILKMTDKMKQYREENGKCYFCGMDFGDRIIEENDSFIAFCPYDSLFTYEMQITSKRHIRDISEFSKEELHSFAILLRNCVKRLARMYEGISYNVCFYNAPKDLEKYTDMHFHAQIISRIGHMAGFEFSTGCYINSVFPEIAAQRLREIDIK
ncbi:MAG: DUF4931 domain-containing protein [Firmicutes bacterium]|nr:DUF4931 domain-containing protein [Bacillota bacterium]